MCYATITFSSFSFFFLRSFVRLRRWKMWSTTLLKDCTWKTRQTKNLQLPVSWVDRTNANLACTCGAAATPNNAQARMQSEAWGIHTAGVAEPSASHMTECACKSPAVHDLKPGNMSDFSCLRLLRATCFLQPCGCLLCPRGVGVG